MSASFSGMGIMTIANRYRVTIASPSNFRRVFNDKIFAVQRFNVPCGKWPIIARASPSVQCEVTTATVCSMWGSCVQSYLQYRAPRCTLGVPLLAHKLSPTLDHNTCIIQTTKTHTVKPRERESTAPGSARNRSVVHGRGTRRQDC